MRNIKPQSHKAEAIAEVINNNQSNLKRDTESLYPCFRLGNG